MIEMDESEYLKSPLEDWQLLLVLFYLGQEEHDKLLYEGEPAYGLSELAERSYNRAVKAWMELNHDWPVGDGAVTGERRQENYPAPVAEALPP